MGNLLDHSCQFVQPSLDSGDALTISPGSVRVLGVGKRRRVVAGQDSVVPIEGPREGDRDSPAHLVLVRLADAAANGGESLLSEPSCRGELTGGEVSLDASCFDGLAHARHDLFRHGGHFLPKDWQRLAHVWQRYRE